MEFNRRFFAPPPVDGVGPPGAPLYVYSDEIVLAVNVALATGRPLLVAGPPGVGKSTLAGHVAHVKRWRHVARVVTSRTRVDDITYGFDALRRLNDAQTPNRLLPDTAYINPGVLWWAFDPESALWRGADPQALNELEKAGFPRAEYDMSGTGPDVVVLLDEIDKAEPDVPNDLLEPLDRKSFRVEGRNQPITARGNVLIIITTNGERELPPAFLRRCVVLDLPPFTVERLTQVAERHLGQEGKALHRPLAEELVASQERARKRGLREPSTAEYLDAIRACTQVGVSPGSPLWNQVAATVLWKDPSLAPEVS